MPTETLLRRPSSVTVAGGGGDVEEVGGGDVDVVAAPVDLVGPVAEHRVEGLEADRHEVGMGDPGAVEPLGGLALLVLADLRERDAFTSASRRDGMNAAMPPIANAPRWWQVLTSSSQ